MTDPAPPDAAIELFGAHLPLAVRYAELLAGEGVLRGVIGPREVPDLWARHLVNCANVAQLLAPDVRVVDVGSGAGLPGIVLAIARPDLRVDLVDSLARRCAFLEQAVELLQLGDRVRVVRGRAEEGGVRKTVGGADVVTARAVAPLERLVRWCVPLVSPGRELLAMKGDRAEAELSEARPILRSLGIAEADVVTVGMEPNHTRVVRIRRRGSASTSRKQALA